MLLVTRFLVILGALSAIYWFIGVATERPLTAAVQPCSTVDVSWEPATPTQGALFRIRLRGVSAATSVTGVVAGEPLHFSAATDSVRESLAAVPIDRPDALDLVVRCTEGGISDSVVRTIPTVLGGEGLVSGSDYWGERARRGSSR